MKKQVSFNPGVTNLCALMFFPQRREDAGI